VLYSTWVAWQEIGSLIVMNASTIIHKGNKNERNLWNRTGNRYRDHTAHEKFQVRRIEE
jgi:hypothetical protein